MLEAETAELRAEVAAVKSSKGGMEYRGVWVPGTYEAGSFVTSSGSLWFAERSTASRPGSGDDDGWRLAVKHGHDGASAYEIAVKKGRL